MAIFKENICKYLQKYFRFDNTFLTLRLATLHSSGHVDPGGPVVIILATGFEDRGLKPGHGQFIFSESKNPKYDFLGKGSKAVGPVS